VLDLLVAMEVAAKHAKTKSEFSKYHTLFVDCDSYGASVERHLDPLQPRTGFLAAGRRLSPYG